MSWHAGEFVDVERTDEIDEDPFRCSWCRRPFDAARMNDLFPPEKKLFEAVRHLRAQGSSLEDLLDEVERLWAQEVN